MMQFLKHSQSPVMAEKMGLRGGVGLAAPQLDYFKTHCRLGPKYCGRGETPQEAYDLQAVQSKNLCLSLYFRTLLLAKEGSPVC